MWVCLRGAESVVLLLLVLQVLLVLSLLRLMHEWKCSSVLVMLWRER